MVAARSTRRARVLEGAVTGRLPPGGVGDGRAGALVAELGRERLALTRDHRRVVVCDLGEPRVREEGIPLRVAWKRREREAVARARHHRLVEVEADEGGQAANHALRLGDEVLE